MRQTASTRSSSSDRRFGSGVPLFGVLWLSPKIVLYFCSFFVVQNRPRPALNSSLDLTRHRSSILDPHCESLRVGFFILFSFSTFVFIIIFVFTYVCVCKRSAALGSRQSTPVPEVPQCRRSSKKQKKPTEEKEREREREAQKASAVHLSVWGFRCHFLTLQPVGNTHLAGDPCIYPKSKFIKIHSMRRWCRRDTKTAFCIDKCILWSVFFSFFFFFPVVCDGCERSSWVFFSSRLLFRDRFFCCSVYLPDLTLTDPFCNFTKSSKMKHFYFNGSPKLSPTSPPIQQYANDQPKIENKRKIKTKMKKNEMEEDSARNRIEETEEENRNKFAFI